jgi:DNA-binding GntR family transcriptional regulator
MKSGDPSSIQLADQIAVQLRAGDWAPGMVVGSEEDLCAQHDIGRSLLRQAVRVVKERGVAYMRRGYGGGLVISEPNPEFASRALAIAIESRMQGYAGLDALLKATDTHLFLTGAPKLSPAACDHVRRTAARLNAMSADDFQLAAGHKEMTRTLRSLFKDPVVALAYQTTAEYGIDFLPYSVSVVEAGRRSELWDLTMRMVEALIAADIAGLFDLRRRQQDIIHAAWRVWSDLDEKDRLVPHLNGSEPSWTRDVDNHAERLAREILRDIRLMGWRVGERIGGVVEIMERYGATIGTVRQAARLLEEHSAVRMERGRAGGLFISTPDPAAAVKRAQDYLTQTVVDPDDVKSFLKQVMLDALTLLAPQRRPLAELRAKTRQSGGHANAATDKIFCGALAALSGNAALEMFVEILNGLLPDQATGGRSADSTLVLKALSVGDGPSARRRFLHYAGGSALLGRP